jgi:hypothetical protein
MNEDNLHALVIGMAIPELLFADEVAFFLFSHN